MDLSRIAIGIKTFLRDAKLFHAIDGIRKKMPECQMIIADDGEMTEEKDGIYADLIREGHKVILCPFDSGFGYKSNRIAENLYREYLLIGSDDFDFGWWSVRMGIEKMQQVLDKNPQISMASGRVDGREYEFNFFSPEPDVFIEEPVAQRNDTFTLCDLTVNYGLVRKSVFIPYYKNVTFWDDDVRIGGGEHASWFIRMKRMGHQIVSVPNANIFQQFGADSEVYRSFRRRALSPERPCFKRLGIKKYILANGVVDYDENEQVY